jgi:membrane-bound ClpP family serine protease
MLLGALLIGLLTAYYFGIQLGITAAVTAALLFLAAAVVPGLSVIIYIAVAVYVAGVCWLGPRRARQKAEAHKDLLRRWSRQMLGKLWRRM